MTMDFNYLDAKAITIETAPDNTLRLMIPDDRCGLRVEVFRAFPLSNPEHQIVLRDGAGKELGILQDLNELPPIAAHLVREQLERRYFLPRVTAIRSVTERFGSSLWDLETDKGHRIVSTKQLNEAVFEISPGRYFITDVEGNRYEIKSLDELDAESRGRFLGKS